MNRLFIQTTPFKRNWEKMGLGDEHLVVLEEILRKNPKVGDVMEGTGGARKLRIALEGRGTRSGGRVIYVDIFEREHIYLLMAYPKNVQDDLTPEQRKMICQMVEAIKKE